MQKFVVTSAMVLCLAGCASTPPTEVPATTSEPQSAAARLDALVESYYEQFLALNPTTATSIGDNRYNDRYLVDFDEPVRQQMIALVDQSLAALREIDPSALDEDRRITFDIFQRNLEASVSMRSFPSYLQPLNQFYNFTASFAQLGSGEGIHPFKTVKDYEDFLNRMEDFDRAVDVAIARLRAGSEAGIVQPRILIERALPQIEAHVVSDVEQSIFYGPIRKLPATFSDSDRERLTRAYADAIRNRVVPAYRRLHAFVRDEYLPKTRTSHGLGALADGKAWYEQLVRNTTTTDLSPEQIHEIGLREVARIHAEMEKVKEQVGFRGTLPEFFKHLQNGPEFHFTSREEMLEEYRAAKARIDASTDRLFDIKPKADYEIRPVEPFRERSAAGGSYQAALPDGSRPGVFYLNTYNPAGRSRYGKESLLLHEGSPGHHFQISVQREKQNLPRLRRFGSFGAYVEGWGLYAESLGRELGLYTDPYQYYGALSGELWRAIRLVLDTGIHAKGWTREQAIEYGLANSSSSETSVTAEVERFMAIPSQALSYKIGQLKITELRRKAERQLGSRFDIKEFHREILEDGAMPLDVLERKIDRWIASR